MKEKDEHIDRYFKERLEFFEDTPGPEVWNIIEDRLGPGKKRKLVIFMSRVAAGILLAVSLGLGYYLLTKNAPDIFTESVEKTGEQEKEKAVTSSADITSSAAEEISGDNLSEEAKIPVTAASEKPGESLTVKHDERITGNEILTAPENIAVNMLTESIIPEKSPGKDYSESRDIPARLKSIAVDKLENKAVEDIKTAEITANKTAEENLVYADYFSADNFTDEEEKSHDSRWTVGGQLAPLYSYRNVSSAYLDSYTKDQINSKESGLIAYAAGLNVAVSPGRRLTVQSGIYYSKYGQQTDAVNIFTYTANDRETGWDDPYSDDETTTNVLITQSIGTVSSNDDLLKFNQSINASRAYSDELKFFNVQNAETADDASATQYFEYIEIPLVIKYKLIDKKIDFNILGGISTHFLIGNNIYLEYNNMNSRFSENVKVNTINYSSSLGIGIEYPVLSRLLLNVEPNFRYYINPLVKNPSYNIHPYSLGIFTGVSYIF